MLHRCFFNLQVVAAYAESLNKFYAKTNAGRTVSAEELTAGLNMSGNASDFVRSVTSAMKTNSTLREVVINNAFGQMEMDAIAYADSIYDGTSISAIATRENINRFVEGADEETLNSVGRALGVDMRTVTPEALAEALVNFRESGKAREYEGAWRDVVAAKELESADNPSTASGPPPFTQGRLKQSAALPSDVSSIQEGATRYNIGGNDVAVIKRGESYRIYDYASGKVTRALTQSELSGVIKRMRGEPAVEVIGRIAENEEFGIGNSELGSAKKIQKLGKVVYKSSKYKAEDVDNFTQMKYNFNKKRGQDGSDGKQEKHNKRRADETTSRSDERASRKDDNGQTVSRKVRNGQRENEEIFRLSNRKAVEKRFTDNAYISPEKNSVEEYEGKLPTPTRFVGLIPKTDKNFRKSSKNSESKE